jgi:hypothetical protein
MRLFFFVDIGGIANHHCLKAIVCFIDIGGIANHHCLKAIACFISHLNSDG